VASTTHGHEEHHPALQHHFDSLEQQKEAATLGMWAFLITEIMLFGGIFMAYMAYRWAYPDIWEAAAPTLNTPLATVNTVVLLVSSLTVALSVNAAEEGKQRRIVVLLLATIVLGFGFLGIKGYEYAEKFSHCAGADSPIAWISGDTHHEVHECLVPGRNFLFPAEEEGIASTEGAGHSTAQNPGEKTPFQLFYLLYFSATGLHAIHMVIGISVMSVITWMAARGRFTPEWFTPVELGGLYWHLIDIIWVFLFPLFYLV
jgi:cytochrome c oxidase subunit 3